MEASLLDFARLNVTNLHAHYEIPAQGLWSLHESGDGTLIPPKAQSAERDPRCAHEPSGPRKLVNNDPGELSVCSDVALKLPPAPSTNAHPTSASDLVSRLRWANLGYIYHWGSKSYDFSKATIPVPSMVQNVCKRIVQQIDWHDVWKDEKEWANGHSEWASWSSNYCD